MTSPNFHNEPAPSLNEDEGVVVAEETSRRTPLRRDISSHQPQATEGLIRFVAGPDGSVVPDLAQKLPGRGLWVKADRDSLDLAVRKNLFSRAAKKAVRADAGLSDTVQALLRRRVLELLGLAKRDGTLLHGFDKVLSSVKAGRADWLFEASDGAADGRRKVISAALAANSHIGLCGAFTNTELSLALGQENVIHMVLLSGQRAGQIGAELSRLSGFEPLAPQEWVGSQPVSGASLGARGLSPPG